MTDVVVVTASVADFDYIHPHALHPDVDYYYYTDEPEGVALQGWDVVKLHHPEHLHPRRTCKIPKIVPYDLPEVKDYRYVIWIDGSIQITNKDFPFLFLGHLKGGILLSPHTDNRDAYSEGVLLAGLDRFRESNEPFMDQVEHYKRMGMPKGMQLYETGVIARDMNDPLVRKFSSIWLNQIMQWAFRDQMSIAYALWQTGLEPDLLPSSWRDTGWLRVHAHKPNRG